MLPLIVAALLATPPDDLLSRLQAMGEVEIRGVVASTADGTTLTHKKLYDALAKARVVYVGETHNHPEHHEVQLHVLEGLYKRNHEIAIGMEMFPRPCQKAIDRYVKGETDVATFLRESNYATVWGYDFEFYRPLLDFAREHHLDVVALNAPQEIARKVSKSGLGALTKAERKQVAAEVDLTDEAHRERVLAELQSAHPIRDEKQLQRYYEGMVLWDETMAESVARYMDERGSDEVQFIVYAGRGHVEDRTGIPGRVHRRNDLPFLTVLPTEVEEPSKIEAKEIAEERGDYVWFTGPAPAPSLPISALNAEVRLEGERFVVTRVGRGAGRAAGLKLGDKLLRFDGQVIFDPIQVDKSLHKKSVYETSTLEVERKGKRVKLTIHAPI